MDTVGGPTRAMVAWRESRALAPDQLSPRVDVAALPFATTADVPALDALVGQKDALDALAFGLEVRGPGFNLYVAGENASGRTTAVHALLARHARSGLLERRLHAEITRRTLLVETTGQQVGQVNGLAVIDLGDSRFAVPTRITATVSPGRGTLCSADGAADLAGPFHNKAVLTLLGYLAHTYGRGAPLTLAATLAFEQSYSAIEGDSASLAELLAVLSALAEVSLEQGVAVTGAVDQRGQIEPVGEVTRKVEGFFAACRDTGLTGLQGVIIPVANAPHLVLDDEVVAAVRAGRFHVWTVRTVDDALALLTDREVGTPGADGEYPEASLHGRALARLRHFGAQLAALRGALG